MLRKASLDIGEAMRGERGMEKVESFLLHVIMARKEARFNGSFIRKRVEVIPCGLPVSGM